MNQINQLKKPPIEAKKRVNQVKIWVQILNGSFLTKEWVYNNIGFIVYCTILLILYIANGYMAENTIREINRLEKEVQDRHAEYITTKSELMYISKYSEVKRMVEEKGLDLKETVAPPLKIEHTQLVSK